jgi:NAD-dependent dihydropyrimidine dehydrogenase PreA subunit
VTLNQRIIINAERCNGCGACIEVCPTGAMYLVDGKAVVDSALCQECEACIAACPTGAIVRTEEAPASGAELRRVPALRPEPEIIRIKTQPAPVPWRARVLPVVGAALAWAGREIVPRLAEHLLYDLDRRTAEGRLPAAPEGTAEGSPSISGRGGGRGGGRRRRRRRRGG